MTTLYIYVREGIIRQTPTPPRGQRPTAGSKLDKTTIPNPLFAFSLAEWFGVK